MYLLNTINLSENANLYGGFDGVNWSYDPVASITPIMVHRAVALETTFTGIKTISGISIEAKAPVDGREHSQAILATGGGHFGSWIARDCSRIESSIGALTVAQRDAYLAGSSYGVLARGLSPLDVTDSIIRTGKGVNGVDRVTGSERKTW